MLDGLRGVAAVAVMVGHRRNWFGAFAVPHYFLAVDFFFLLSGFVIDHAYAGRVSSWRERSDFLVRRIMRLFPLILAAGVLAALCQLARLHSAGQPIGWAFLVQCVAGILVLPTFFEDHVFPFNIPLWSLFFEAIANLAFMLIAPRVTLRWLIVIVAACGACLAYSAFPHGLETTGVTRTSFIAGFPRVGFSFAAGCLINRLRREGRFARIRLGGLEPVVLLALISMPFLPLDPFYQLLCVMVVFPILLAAGANDRPRFPGFAIFSGNLSYPLYVLHVPLLFTVAAILKVTGVADLHAEPGPAQAIFRLLAVILLATLAFYLYDRPVRARLGRWWRARASGAAGAPNLS